METSICSSRTVENAQSPLQICIAEGDWVAYKRWITKEDVESSIAFKSYKTETAYFRACALAYLGRRAQLHGGVCSRTQPRVLTSAFIASLEGANRSERFRRYPWLETLLSLLAQIDRVHEDVAFTGNVISLVPVSKPL
ncbi:hypothetical protein KTQ42_19845 [Noviherbaspirillum sp. L7-7A]|uniref:hypothetical protein n=1 Tax=Noviherbaspirillum sp. L7-7A TaxID=2850560 RepID=UPI001C2C2826|nr:hypothetical protein [Noviherbaspirillum sp. L7-7A]MBV0881543.1 hypothetical protein [Noviherbaspirillum sp. L7-7A]